MTQFIECTGNLLEAEADALVNTVNVVGVMGKGIALQFKNAYPANFKAYAKACKTGDVKLGKVFVFNDGQLTEPRLIINFPTKGHWRNGSKLADVASGLDDLRQVIIERRLKTVALPPLGCGNGGLDWNVVRPLIETKLENLDTRILLYLPVGAPAAARMPVATERPALTPSRAAVIALIDRYAPLALGASLIEIQKLVYFLQEAGEDLQMEFVQHHYGPYADSLRHVLKSMEGHYITGFGDGSKPVRDAETIELLPGAVIETVGLLSERCEADRRLNRVLALVDGFESPYGLELLASVHWVATRVVRDSADLSAIATAVHAWSHRKRHVLSADHIEVAWQRLQTLAWLEAQLSTV